MDPASETRPVVAPPGRAAGTDAERRAAIAAKKRLAHAGRNAEVQPIEVRPRFALTHAIHCLIAVTGSVVAAGAPAVGTALALAAAVSAFLDVSGTLHLVRRLTGRRASQNVEAGGAPDMPGLLLLTAQLDAPRASAAFRWAKGRLRDPWLAMLLAIMAIVGCCVARLAGVEGTGITAVQFVPTVLLIVMVPALVDVELSPAAADESGAAAVATVLRLAEELDGRLESFEVRVVLTGAAEPFALGMARWLRTRRRELDRERTAVLSVGRLGDGPVRFTVREGPLVPLRCHRELVRICEEIAEDDGKEGAYSARRRISRDPTPAAAAIARGLPALTVTCEGASPTLEGLDRAYGFCRELAERLDAEIGTTLVAG